MRQIKANLAILILTTLTFSCFPPEEHENPTNIEDFVLEEEEHKPQPSFDTNNTESEEFFSRKELKEKAVEMITSLNKTLEGLFPLVFPNIPQYKIKDVISEIDINLEAETYTQKVLCDNELKTYLKEMQELQSLNAYSTDFRGNERRSKKIQTLFYKAKERIDSISYRFGKDYSSRIKMRLIEL